MSQDDIARVTVIAPNRRIDLALPGDALLGELLPSILKFAGQEAQTPEALQSWVLQRVGEDALDVNKLVSALSLRDGETLHLRPRDSVMPDVAFDDVVDAVATTASARPSWVPAHSQRLALAVLAAVLVGGSLLTLITDRTPAVVLCVLGLSLASGITAVVAARAYRRLAVAATLAWCCVGTAAMAGFFLLGDPDIRLVDVPGSAAFSLQLLVGTALGLLAAGTMALAAQVQVHALMTTCITLVLLALTGVPLAFMPTKGVEIASVAITLLLALTPAMPTLSYSLAQIALPNLPSSVELLVADEQPVQSDIVARATMADRLLTVLLTATAISTALLSIPVVLSGRLPALLLIGAVSLALLLRARGFVGRTQRLVLLLGGLATGGLASGWLLLHPGTGALRLLLATVTVLVLAAILAMYASTFYSRIMAPIWGRIGDIVEWIAVIAVVPLLLWVLELYALARGLPG